LNPARKLSVGRTRARLVGCASTHNTRGTGFDPTDTNVPENHHMRTRRSLAAFASLFLIAAAVPAIVYADDTGTAGYVDKVDINTPSADAYLQFHGRVIVASGKGGANKVEYRWGGTSCGTRTMPEELVQILVQSSRDSNIVVTPRFQLGQGDAKCLVGFSMQDKR
jgi:hypothetical protein